MKEEGMKDTLLRISVSQDGLLPEESADVAKIPLPVLPKKLIKALGFERVDANTFVGVVPVFIKLGSKEQEIEIELGVDVPEMRKKIIELIKSPQAQVGGEYSVAESESNVINLRKKAAKPAKKPPKGKKKSNRS